MFLNVIVIICCTQSITVKFMITVCWGKGLYQIQGHNINAPVTMVKKKLSGSLD